jgi:hypothetical protein
VDRERWLIFEIPATQKMEIGRIMVQGQFRHKVSEIPSQSINQTWWYAPVITTMQEATGQKI